MKLRTTQTHFPIPTFSGRSIPLTGHYTLWVHSFVYFLISSGQELPNFPLYITPLNERHIILRDITYYC